MASGPRKAGEGTGARRRASPWTPTGFPMRRCSLATSRGAVPQRSILWSALVLALLVGTLSVHPAAASDAPSNVVLHVIPREILIFSAQAGVWTSIRLDSGERILQRAADHNVAAVVTSQRVIGFSAVLNLTHEIRLTEDETLEAFRVEGNVATVLTRRRGLGFSAATGKWAEIDRFQLGR